MTDWAGRYRASLSLLRWLGPWATDAHIASGCRDMLIEHRSGGRDLRLRVYRPNRRAIGVYLIAPGLHYEGPDDPRLDRFCRALASAGMLTVAPYLPSFLSLVLRSDTGADLAVGLDYASAQARRLGLPPPAIFAISFGSAPALELASGPSAGQIGGLILFGGFCNFRDTVHFAVTGQAQGDDKVVSLKCDPLNCPVVFLNLLDHLPIAGPKDVLAEAWRQMVVRTWGRVELKLPGARDSIAHEISATLPPSLQEMFLVGCGLHPGGGEMVARAFDRAGDQFAFMDAGPRLRALKPPTVVVHGRDDDVIPYLEAHKLMRMVPAGHPVQLHLTGMYGHTGAERPPLSEAAKEAVTMLRMLRDMVNLPSGLGCPSS